MSRPKIAHRSRVLDAGDMAVHVYRGDVFALCRRHDVDPHETARIELLRPCSLRFVLYNRNQDGHRYTDDRTDKAATRTVDVLRSGRLPEWWKP